MSHVRLFDFVCERVVFLFHADRVALRKFPGEEFLADAVLNVGLNGTLQRTGTKLYVVTLRSHVFLGLVGEFQMVA